MRKLAFLVAAASLFALAPISERFGPIASAVAMVWTSVLLAIFASGAAHAVGVASGAMAAFVGGILLPISPAAAGAVFVGAAFVERSTRVRTRNGRALHVLIALVGGALAGTLATAFQSASFVTAGVAVVVASVLSGLPFLVEADDPTAHALDQAADAVSEPAKTRLHDGAELRRTMKDVPLDKSTRERVKKTWQSLLKLAEARTRLERNRPVTVRVAVEGETPAPSAAEAVLEMVDKRIGEHVDVLARAAVAVDTAHAAAVGIDDAALKNVESIGDTLEETSRAMVEVRS